MSHPPSFLYKKSYDLSLSTAQQFRNIIQGLLLNPVKVDVSRSSLNGDLPSRTFGAVSGQIKRFEVKQVQWHIRSILGFKSIQGDLGLPYLFVRPVINLIYSY